MTGDLTINASVTDNGFISLVGSGDQTITSSLAGYLTNLNVANAGNVDLPTTLVLDSGTLTGTGTFLGSVQFGLDDGNDYRTSFVGTIEDAVLNMDGGTLSLFQPFTAGSLNVLNSALLHDESGNGTDPLIVTGNLAIDGELGGDGFVSLQGDTDQSFTGTGTLDYLDISKPSGDVLFGTFNKTFHDVTVSAGQWDVLGNTITASNGFFIYGGELSGAGTLNGNLTMYAGSTYFVTVNGDSTAPLAVSGQVYLDPTNQGVALTGVTSAVTSTSAPIPFLTYGSFAGADFASAPEGSTVDIGGSYYAISYDDNGGGNSFTLTPVLTIAGNQSTVTATVGQSASNTGSFDDFLNSPDVTIGASFGSIMQVGSGASGTWTWTSPANLQVAQSQIVVISADDTANDLTATFSFPLIVQPSTAAPTTTTLLDNGPNPSLSGVGVGFTVSVSSVHSISGETVKIEDVTNVNNPITLATPTLTNGTATLTLSTLSVGDHTLIAVYSGDSNNQGSQTTTPITQVVQSTFAVDSVTATPDGVVLTFNAPINPNTTVLYSSPGDTTLGAADVTIVGATVGRVRGSLVIDPTNPYIATFVQTSGLLAADTYTVTVTTAVKALVGTALSGNYSTTLTVTAPTTPVLSVPSFARGPGQTVALTDSQGNRTGIPISIGNATHVTQVGFSLTYDPHLLTIAGSGALSLSSAATAAGLAIQSYTISSVDANHSVLTVSISGGTGFTATTAAPLVTILASVPTTAPYLDKEVLNLGSVQVNGANATGVSSVSVVAYPGDVLGTGLPNATDASLVDQVASGSGTGFSVFKDLDPAIIGGVGGGLLLNANDASLIDEAASGATVAQIPSIPVGVSLTFGGPDPYLYLSAVQGAPGQTVTETLYLDVTDPHGIQLTALDEAIGFNANALQISDVRATGALAALGSYDTASTVDNGSGEFLVAQAFMGTGLPPVVPYGTDIPVLQFNVTVNADMGIGSETGLTLLQYGTVNNVTQYTAISDNEGALTWTPGKAPSNSGNRSGGWQRDRGTGNHQPCGGHIGNDSAATSGGDPAESHRTGKEGDAGERAADGDFR